MTNEQLKIMLASQAALLEQAIEKSAELMPEDAPREIERHYIGPKRREEPSAENIVLNMDPKNWEEKPIGRYLALIPMYEHFDLLREHIKNLEDKRLFYLGGEKPEII